MEIHIYAQRNYTIPLVRGQINSGCVLMEIGKLQPRVAERKKKWYLYCEIVEFRSL